MSLYSFLKPDAPLVNVHQGIDFIQCQCPACAAEGHDKTGRNHLRIYKDGAFVCAKYKGSDDKTQHNRIIRGLLRRGDAGEVEVYEAKASIDTDPNARVERFYPEEVLKKLVPDYTYWAGRKPPIDPEIVRRFEGGVAPRNEKGPLSGRFVFPLRDDQRRIVGWSGRILGSSSFTAKWKHLGPAPGVLKRLCWPWYLNGGDIQKAKTVILIESIGNGLRLSQGGINCWLALLGTTLNDSVIGHLMAAAPRRIIISTDNDQLRGAESTDKAGNRAANQFKTKLGALFGEDAVVVRQSQSAKDWGEASEEELAAFKQEVYNV